MVSRQSLRSQFTEILHLKESPHRTALAFALGVFIAFTPTYGFHFLTAVLFAWGFRLNFLALLLGSFVNNPWTVVPILGLTLWIGFLLLGMPDTSVQWESLNTATFYDALLPYVIPFALGGMVLSLAGLLLSYPIAFLVISQYRKSRSPQPSRAS